MKKIFNKIKKFLKENYKGILILVFIFFICNYKLDVSIYAPGGLINMNDRITSEDKIYEGKGSINMTYVSMVKGTIPTYLLSYIIPTWDTVKNENITYDGEDLKNTIEIDRYYFKQSISNAYKVAFDAAGVEYSITKTNNYIIHIDENAKTNLKLFDNILKYDNIEFTTFQSMQDYIESKNVGDKIEIEVERNGKIINCEATLIDIEGTAKIGISSIMINEYESTPQINVKTKSSESGASGGFMTALAIYNSLMEDDITKGLKIAGTGTIDENGNVGIIGGVKYKLSGAVKNKADIFLVAKDNYEEAYEYKKEQNFDIELVSISNFKEAIDYLNNMEV